MKYSIAAIVLATLASTSISQAGQLTLSPAKPNVQVSATKAHAIPCQTVDSLGGIYRAKNSTGKTIFAGERIFLEEWQILKSLKKVRIGKKFVVVQNNVAPNASFTLGNGNFGCSAWTTNLSRVKVDGPVIN